MHGNMIGESKARDVPFTPPSRLLHNSMVHDGSKKNQTETAYPETGDEHGNWLLALRGRRLPRSSGPSSRHR